MSSHALINLILMVVLAVGGCGRRPVEQEAGAPLRLGVAAQAQTIRFQPQRFLRESKGCADAGPRCARIRAEYPLAVGSPAGTVAFLNDTIGRRVRQSLSVFALSPEDVLPDLDAIAARFISDYDKYAADMGEYQTHWEVETRVEVLFQSPRLVTLSINNFSFTGGAHPNAFLELLNVDLDRRRLLRLPDVVADSVFLKKLVERKFREYHQLDPAANLNEAGFFWDQGLFLPGNFAIRQEGLYLYYNNYEVAPYAVGSTEIIIPWADLEGRLRMKPPF